jgi:hypothetical protein
MLACWPMAGTMRRFSGNRKAEAIRIEYYLERMPLLGVKVKALGLKLLAGTRRLEA